MAHWSARMPGALSGVRRAAVVQAPIALWLPVCRHFAATELRMLRGAVGNFYDMLGLAVRTMEQFGGSKSR
jgi:hypothetical protein